ncbi:MAG: ATP F0F1 synthase subunit B [Alphaproteobacteria bacterium]|nr:ATP F0F1 synthase subunit B [Alphaproteobacteria bacterium]
MSGVFGDPTFWVGVGTALFVLLLIRLKVPAQVGAMLDARAAAIKAELEEARRLRAEAEALLADYKKKTANAADEAQAIIDAAKAAADRMAADAKVALQQQIERRAKMAEQKIAQAEADALAEVRAAATAAASAAAREVIAKRMTDARGDALIDSAIAELGTKLH